MLAYPDHDGSGEAARRAANIFLIGPMGAGKSTIGHCLAELLHKEFLDADHEIEARTGASIPLIFEIEGEAGFRKRETAVLDDLTQRNNIVLATGGGAVLAAENRRRLQKRGIVVYLQAPLDMLVKRTRHDRHRPCCRPVIDAAHLRILLPCASRCTETADIVVETSTRPP